MWGFYDLGESKRKAFEDAPPTHLKRIKWGVGVGECGVPCWEIRNEPFEDAPRTHLELSRMHQRMKLATSSRKKTKRRKAVPSPLFCSPRKQRTHAEYQMQTPMICATSANMYDPSLKTGRGICVCATRWWWVVGEALCKKNGNTTTTTTTTNNNTPTTPAC